MRSAASSSRRPSPPPPAERRVVQLGPPRLCPAFRTEEPSARCDPRPAVVSGCGGRKRRRSFYSFRGLLWRRRRTVRTSEGSETRLRLFQPGALQRPAQPSGGAPSETHLPPVHAHRDALHPPHRLSHLRGQSLTLSACLGLRSLSLYYWRLSTLKEKKNCCYSI